MIRRIAAVSALLLLAGCMEVEQTTPTPKAAGTTVRKDTAAWSNAPLPGGPAWTKGDRTSWETQIKKRHFAQHEDRRIYQ